MVWKSVQLRYLYKEEITYQGDIVSVASEIQLRQKAIEFGVSLVKVSPTKVPLVTHKHTYIACRTTPTKHQSQLEIVQPNLCDIPRSMNARRYIALKMGINRRSTLRQSRFSSSAVSARGASSSTAGRNCSNCASSVPLSKGRPLWLSSGELDMMSTIPLWRQRWAGSEEVKPSPSE